MPQAVALLATSIKSSAMQYNALVLPHLDNYCSVVWQECTKGLTMKLERVQNYGIRVILYFHSHPEQSGQLRKRLIMKWMSIEKRKMARAVLVRRCVLKKASIKG